jgi:hypothetical protein
MWTCRHAVRPRLRFVLAGGLLALVTISGAAAGPLQDGRAAFKRHDFAETVRRQIGAYTAKAVMQPLN